MNKTLSLIISVLLCICLAGCNSEEKEPENAGSDSSITESVSESESKEEQETEPKVIIEDETEEETEEDKPEEKKVDVTNLYYWVNFLNKDGTVLSRETYKYGSIPNAPSDPYYSDGVYIYSFIGWDKPLSAVHMTQIYTAQYEITGVVAQEPDTSIYIGGVKCEKGAIIELEDYDDNSDGIADTHKYLILAMGSTVTKEDDGEGNKYKNYNGTTVYDSINEFVEGEGNQLLLLSMETWKTDRLSDSGNSVRYFDRYGDTLVNETFYNSLTDRVKAGIVEEYITKTVMKEVENPTDESQYDIKTFTNWKVGVGIRDEHKIDTYYDIDENNGWTMIRMPRKVYLPDAKDLMDYAMLVHSSCTDNKEYDYCFEDLMSIFSIESVSDMNTKFGQSKLWTRSEFSSSSNPFIFSLDSDKNKLIAKWMCNTNYLGIRPEFVLDTDLYLNYTEAPE